MPGSESASQVSKYAKSGLLFGLCEALGFSVFGLVALFGRAISAHEYVRIVAGYFIGFGLGGLLAGVLWKPLRRSGLGAAILAFVVLAPVWAGATLAYVGWTKFLTTTWTVVWVSLSVLTGCGLGLQAWTSEEWPFDKRL